MQASRTACIGQSREKIVFRKPYQKKQDNRFFLQTSWMEAVILNTDILSYMNSVNPLEVTLPENRSNDWNKISAKGTEPTIEESNVVEIGVWALKFTSDTNPDHHGHLQS